MLYGCCCGCFKQNRLWVTDLDLVFLFLLYFSEDLTEEWEAINEKEWLLLEEMRSFEGILNDAVIKCAIRHCSAFVLSLSGLKGGAVWGRLRCVLFRCSRELPKNIFRTKVLNTQKVEPVWTAAPISANNHSHIQLLSLLEKKQHAHYYLLSRPHTETHTDLDI